MVDTMVNTRSVIEKSNNNVKQEESYQQKTQNQIIAGLLRQQPQIIQAKVSPSPPPPRPAPPQQQQQQPQQQQQQQHPQVSAATMATIESMSSVIAAAMVNGPQMMLTNPIEYGQILSTIQALTNGNSPLNKAFTTMMLSEAPAPPPPPKEPPAVAAIQEDAARPSSSTSPESTRTAISPGAAAATAEVAVEVEVKPSEPEYKPRNVRSKVYADGFIMSFDKKSCCGTKDFWRCERKNDCNARLHSVIDTRQIVRKLHPHNHDAPTPEELAFYEQDFSVLGPNIAHPVKSINRAHMQRKLSRANNNNNNNNQSQVTTAPLAAEPMDVDVKPSTNSLLQAAVAAATAAASPPEQAPVQPVTTGKKRNRASLSPGKRTRAKAQPKAIKREVEDVDEIAKRMMLQADFRNTYQLTQKIVELMKPKNEIGVQWTGSQESLLIFMSKDDGANENVFLPVVVMKKDEKSLITALEDFAGKTCEGKVAMSFSQKVNVLVHEALINNWPHGKLFLLNTDTPSLWRLTPVDAYGRVLNTL